VSGPIRGKEPARRAAGTTRAAAQPRTARASTKPARASAKPARASAKPARASAKPARASARPAFAVAAATRAASIALPLPAPWHRTRAPKRDRAPKRERAPKPSVGLGRRVGSFAVALPDHPWLDRVIRGRAWIPLLGVLLAGIVASQVEILKAGASMGRALEQTTSLTTQNEQLQGTVAQLADDQRIERLADNMGLVFPPPGAVGYIHANPGGAPRRAVGNIHTPDAGSFVLLAAKNGALVTGSGTSTLPPVAGAPLPPTTPTTPTTTPTANGSAPSSAATTSSASASAEMTNTTSTTSATGATSTSTVPTQTATTPESTATTTPAAGTTSPPASSTTPTESSTAPYTGAAAISPSGTTQQSTGG
jgi:hypothetical protein